MTRNELRGLAAIIALVAVVLVAVPVLGVDPSRSPSTGTVPSAAPSSGGSSASPAAAPSSPAPSSKAATPLASPDEANDDDQGGKPDNAAKPQHDQDAPDHPVTLTGLVGRGTGEDGDYTLTVGSAVYALEAGPKWWWGDANPLGAVVGKKATISGDQAPGSNDIEVQSIDGKAIRPAGKPPWAGGWKVVGPKHPGWAQWKVDKLAGKGKGPASAPDQQAGPSPAP